MYLLQNQDGQFYTGQAKQLPRRLGDHDQQKVKFTRDNPSFELIYYEEFETRAKAMQREKQIKGWSRAKKQALVDNDIEKLKQLSRPHN